jgi:putative membrane protein
VKTRAPLDPAADEHPLYPQPGQWVDRGGVDMIRMLISAALHLGANAVGLAVAAMLLDGMTIDVLSFVVAVVIFTVVEVVSRPYFTSLAMKGASYLQGATALAATLAGLVITTLISDGLRLEGLATWIYATLIVWVAALLAAIVLPVLFVKSRLEDRPA